MFRLAGILKTGMVLRTIKLSKLYVHGTVHRYCIKYNVASVSWQCQLTHASGSSKQA